MNTQIYIMSNSKNKVKIGFSNNPNGRRDDANKNSFIDEPFVIYATYKTPVLKKPDKLLHDIIDSINPMLRKRKNKEFYEISPEVAISVLERIAKITGTIKNLDVRTKADVKKQKRRSANFQFSDFGIKKGAELTFKNTKIKCKVKNDREVIYKGKTYAISTLASKLLKELENKNQSVSGIHYFRYKGKRVIDYKK